ncbi:stage II sporulation protein M [Thalassobacillus sp. CUG 92003]|uniref:stage II sporulation protein M n=1 Tax=Thalassobacillus sp. CUG 92003 TaxID=2736641 RepID=UPI0015E74A81|nr:stage II sporulation protein M [Thalassobacillus sp. CUG 92003]
MRRGIRLVRNDLTHHVNIYIFIFVLFFIGIIFGAIIVNSMNFIQRQDLFFYLKQFFQLILDTEGIDSTTLWKDTFFYHLKYMLLLFILGISVIGMPVITVLLFIKGLVVGFSVGFLVNQMGWYGFIVSSVAIAPQNLLIIPIYLVAGSMALIFSMTLFRQLFVRRVHQPLLPIFGRYTITFLGLFGVLIIASLIEVFISNYALEAVIRWIYK